MPDSVCRAYGVERLKFGRDYIIPKPFDPRVLVWEACAVAKAAMETGVAQNPVDLDEYREQLERRLGKAHELMRIMIHKAQRDPKRVVFPEGESRENPARLPHPDRREDRHARSCWAGANEIQRKAAELGFNLERRRHRRTRNCAAARRSTSTSSISLRQRGRDAWQRPTS